MFSLSYKFFTFIKPYQMLLIISTLLNKTDLKFLINIPSLYILFNSILSDLCEGSPPSFKSKCLCVRLVAHKLINFDNKG